MISFFLKTILVAGASLPQNKSTVTPVFELLTMPTKNAAAIVSQKPDSYVLDLKTIAFSQKFPIGTRWRALSLALQSKHTDSEKLYDQSLKHPEWFIRNVALLSGSQFSEAKQSAAALELIKDKALVVRSAAVAAIRDVNDAKTRDVLWQELNAAYNFRGKQSLWVRGEILEKLSLNPKKHERSLFEQASKENDKRVKLFATRALAKL